MNDELNNNQSNSVKSSNGSDIRKKIWGDKFVSKNKPKRTKPIKIKFI